MADTKIIYIHQLSCYLDTIEIRLDDVILDKIIAVVSQMNPLFASQATLIDYAHSELKYQIYNFTSLE
jgi:hypothetical protein